MLLKTPHGDREYRGHEFGSSDIPPPGSGWIAHSGASVTLNEAMGLPAVSAAIRLVAETVGMLPLLTYRGDGPDRERARDAWQYGLLHDEPNEEQSPFDFQSDIGASIEAGGNGYIFKAKRRGRVWGLLPIQWNHVRVRRDKQTKKKVFDVSLDGKTQTFDSRTIIHVRGFTPTGGDVGWSPITYHRHSLGEAISQAEFGSKFFRNDATPGGAISVPGTITQEQAREMLDYWKKHHQGAGLAHEPAVFYNNARWEKVGVSLEDSQFIEGRKHSVEEVARIFRVPPSLLGAFIAGERGRDTQQEAEWFEKFSLGPRLRRIERALRRDKDLFPEGGDLFPEFLSDALLRADTKTRYEAYRVARQGGWISANEIRQKENLPPKEGGDEIQETPVGGAPNPPN